MRFLFRWFDKYRNLKKYDPVKKCEVYKKEGCSHVDGMLCDMKTCSTLEQYRNKNIHCPVCGYLCVGRGGMGCIDKPKLIGKKEGKVDIEKMNVCFDLGITYHEDLGIDKDGFYREKVRVGPIERIFKINRSLIDDVEDLCDNPGNKRLEYLKKNVDELYEQIKKAMSLVYPVVLEEECVHGKGIYHYCEPCGRVNGG